MIKTTKAQEIKACIARKDNLQEKKFKSMKFPNCIGLFPDDCKGVTKSNINECCKTCVYYKR